jgi:hypothetical protein
MSPALRFVAALGRAAAIGVTAATLLATTVPRCRDGESARYAVEGSCGPAGEITLSFQAEEPDGCSNSCWAFLEAPGAGAVGLPEQGEVDASGRGGLDGGRLVLLGPVPLAGDTAGAVVRTCRFTRVSDGVLRVECTGDDPAAACAGTATRIPEPGPAP